MSRRQRSQDGSAPSRSYLVVNQCDGQGPATSIYRPVLKGIGRSCWPRIAASSSSSEARRLSASANGWSLLFASHRRWLALLRRRRSALRLFVSPVMSFRISSGPARGPVLPLQLPGSTNRSRSASMSQILCLNENRATAPRLPPPRARSFLRSRCRHPQWLRGAPE